MQYDDKTDLITFSSGNQVCAHDGIVGLTSPGPETWDEIETRGPAVDNVLTLPVT